MGRVYAPVFEKAGHEVYITGRESKITPVEAAKICDLTIVSVDIPNTQDVIRRVAPYSPALMDFTSVKTYPLRWMEEFAGKNTEICGGHPNHGFVDSIEGKVFLSCPTESTGERCRAALSAIRKSGAQVEEITPKENDLYMNGIATLGRTLCLDIYTKLLQRENVDLDWFYRICPPPTKVVLDFIARQVAGDNDMMYCSMEEYNPYAKRIKRSLLRCARSVIARGMPPREIREMYGKKILDAAQKSAARIINRGP